MDDARKAVVEFISGIDSRFLPINDRGVCLGNPGKPFRFQKPHAGRPGGIDVRGLDELLHVVADDGIAPERVDPQSGLIGYVRCEPPKG